MDTAIIIFVALFVVLIGIAIYAAIDLNKNPYLSERKKRHWFFLVGGVPLFGALIYLLRKPRIQHDFLHHNHQSELN